MSKFNSQQIFLSLSILVLAATIFLFGMQMGQNGKAEITNPQDDSGENQEIPTLDEDDDAMMGEADAPILMVEFSDYQCPYCRKFYNETLGKIKENYIDTGLVKLVYRDLPLVSLGHTDATPAANAAECARAQGGDDMYFSFHDKIFEGQNELGTGTVVIPKESLFAYAEELNLDMETFTSCQENQDYYDEIQADLSAARAAEINGTPAFVINGQLVTGAYPYETFESLFEEILNK